MKNLVVILIAATQLVSCMQPGSETIKISSADKSAESVFLTRDHKGNPVVAWTEKSGDATTLLFSISTDDGKTFSEKRSVLLNPKVATHAEGMPKLAYKANGTILVAYEIKAPTKENKYAGAICFIISKDEGKSWSPERYMHRDTISGKSRSYFDIETLPDGEIGASWLDIKLDGEKGGRSVLFARTNEDDSFSQELLIDSSACQCCRTDVYTDVNKNVFVSYRGLRKGNMGKSIRDMMVCSSQDGRTFTAPLTISADNWNIDGCPHTGPSLCSNKAGLMTLWYTEGSGTGIYYAHKSDNDSFSARQLVSSAGRHPQVSSNGDRIAMLWEENIENGGSLITTVNCQLLQDGIPVEKKVLTQHHANAFLPVVTATKKGFLVAYLMELDEQVSVFVTTL